MKGRKKDLASRPINHPRKQSTQGLVESSVDVSSVLLRSDNDSVPKGNILSVWYLFRNRALEKVGLYRVFFANREPVISTTTTRQEWQEGEDQFARGRPTAHRYVVPGCRSILCVIPGPACYGGSLLTSLSMLLHKEVRSKPNERMCFSD
jgi:hypothetical protein